MPRLAVINLSGYRCAMASTRREEILGIAAELFAARGFHGVSVAELGAACGMSGPALYKHFAGKDALLAEMLVSTSEELLTIGRLRVRQAATPRDAVADLVDWHISFALDRRATIVIQDRDWSALPDEAREQVRTLQRKYVDLWARALRQVHHDLKPLEAKARVHAVFGLLNSTPHSALIPDARMRSMLHEMALAALWITPDG
jgi:AcrR family transcriptional regulator